MQFQYETYVLIWRVRRPWSVGILSRVAYRCEQAERNKEKKRVGAENERFEVHRPNNAKPRSASFPEPPKANHNATHAMIRFCLGRDNAPLTP